MHTLHLGVEMQSWSKYGGETEVRFPQTGCEAIRDNFGVILRVIHIVDNPEDIGAYRVASPRYGGEK